MIKKVASLFLIFSMIIQVFSTHGMVFAAGQITLKGFSGDIKNTTKGNALYVYGDDGKGYILYPNTNLQNFTNLAHKRIEFTGELISNEVNVYQEVKPTKINEINVNSDPDIVAFHSNGTIKNKIMDKYNNDLSIFKFEDKINQEYLVYTFSGFTDDGYFNKQNTSNQSVEVNGYLIRSSNQVVLNEIKTSKQQGELQNNNYTVSITKSNQLTSSIQSYSFVFDMTTGSYPSSGNYQLYFSKDILNDKFPSADLSGKKLLIYGKEDVKKKLIIVQDWNIYSKAGSIQDDFSVLSVRTENNDSITYNVIGYDNPSIKYLTFNKSTFANRYPNGQLSLVGKSVNVVGNMTDATTLMALDYVEILSNNQLDPSNPTDTKSIEENGTLMKRLVYDDSSINYLFENFDGKQYILYFKNNDGQTLPGIDKEGQKITVHGNVSGMATTTPILTVSSYTFKDSNFVQFENEIMAQKGTIIKLISSNPNEQTYEFKGDDGITYTLNFIKNVLKDSFPKSIQSGTKFEIVGYGDYQKKSVSVISFRNLSEKSQQSNPIKSKNGETYYMIGLNVTLTRILNEKDNQITYEGISEKGIKYSLQLSRNVMKDNYPNQYLIGQSFSIYGMYKEGKNNISVYTLSEKGNQNISSSDKGTFGKALKTTKTSVLYSFVSVKGNEYEILVPNHFSELSMTGKQGIVYGKKSEFDAEQYFTLLSFNEIKEKMINEKIASQISFKGHVKEVANQTANGITYYAYNQYDQFALLYFDKNELKEHFPKDLVNKEIVINGYLYDNGVIYVLDYNFINVPNEYPNKKKLLFEEVEDFPNMTGYTGLLSVLTTDTSHFVLTTSDDTFVLEGNENVMKKVEDNMGKMVYLKGERSEVSRPYWTGKIKVYALDVLSNRTDVIINPIGQPVNDPIPDPFKKAVHTIQNIYKPETFPYGDGIIESKYIPEFLPNPSPVFTK